MPHAAISCTAASKKHLRRIGMLSPFGGGEGIFVISQGKQDMLFFIKYTTSRFSAVYYIPDFVVLVAVSVVFGYHDSYIVFF